MKQVILLYDALIELKNTIKTWVPLDRKEKYVQILNSHILITQIIFSMSYKSHNM